MTGLIDDRDLRDAGLVKRERGVAVGRRAVVVRGAGHFVDAVKDNFRTSRQSHRRGVDRRSVVPGHDDLIGEPAGVDVEQREADVRNSSRMREVDRGRDGFGRDRRLSRVINVEQQRLLDRNESACIGRVIDRAAQDTTGAASQRDADCAAADGVALTERPTRPIHRVPIQLREQVLPGLLRRQTEDCVGLNKPDVSFQIPIAAERRVAGGINRAGDVRAGQVREHLFGRQPDEPLRKVAAVNQDVRTCREMLAELLQPVGVIAGHRVEIQHGRAEMQLTALSV